MAVNSAKQRMLEGKPAIGGEVGLGSTVSAELLAAMAFDFVIVDNQHGAWDERSTMSAFRSIALGPSVPMARVGRNDYGAIGRLLDMGALGIVVPMVNSAEEAQAAATAVRYPPRGTRSSGAFGAGFWGPDYDEWIDREVFLAVQIETVEAVERAKQIMDVDGIDGCWIGPGDLGYSLGVDRSTKKRGPKSTPTPSGASSRRATRPARSLESGPAPPRTASGGSMRAVCSSPSAQTRPGSGRAPSRLSKSLAADNGSVVGVAGIEPATSCSQSRRASAALHPEGMGVGVQCLGSGGHRAPDPYSTLQRRVHVVPLGGLLVGVADSE